MQPEAFGLHSNADITKDLAQTDAMLASLLLAGGGGGAAGGGACGDGGGGGEAAVVRAMVTDILGKLPEQFDVEKAQARYPVRYEESMNQVWLADALYCFLVLTPDSVCTDSFMCSVDSEILPIYSLDGVRWACLL